MNEFELRLRLQNTVQDYVNQLMTSNNVPAAMMEDALNKVLVNLKDKVLLEFIAAASQPQPIQEEEVEEQEDGE